MSFFKTKLRLFCNVFFFFFFCPFLPSFSLSRQYFARVDLSRLKSDCEALVSQRDALTASLTSDNARNLQRLEAQEQRVLQLSHQLQSVLGPGGVDADSDALLVGHISLPKLLQERQRDAERQAQQCAVELAHARRMVETEHDARRNAEQRLVSLQTESQVLSKANLHLVRQRRAPHSTHTAQESVVAHLSDTNGTTGSPQGDSAACMDEQAQLRLLASENAALRRVVAQLVKDVR